MNEKDKALWLEEVLTVKEVAEAYQVLTPRLQQTLRNKRKIRFAMAGTKVIYKRRWIEDYLSAKVVEVAQ